MFLLRDVENKLTVVVFTPMPGALTLSSVPPKLPLELGLTLANEGVNVIGVRLL